VPVQPPAVVPASGVAKNAAEAVYVVALFVLVSLNVTLPKFAFSGFVPESLPVPESFPFPESFAFAVSLAV
jgi:hypothetical protein